MHRAVQRVAQGQAGLVLPDVAGPQDLHHVVVERVGSLHTEGVALEVAEGAVVRRPGAVADVAHEQAGLIVVVGVLPRLVRFLVLGSHVLDDGLPNCSHWFPPWVHTS